MSAPVFLAESGVEHVVAGDRYVLDGAEGRHAGVVQRKGRGERVDVVDGDGLRLRCVVEDADAGRVTLLVQEVAVDPAPGVVVTLVQALAKGDRDEMAIEAATEVGVDAVVPWQAERSVVVWRGERAAKSRARWLGTVRTATKQARRARLPRVELPVDSRGLAERVGQVVAAGGRAIVLHEEATTALADVPLPAPRRGQEPGAADAGPGGAPQVLVVVGPEGGISESELAAFTAAGAVAARLGPHVLRTSTAGPVAIALLAQRLGRWGVED
ncbi:16S rRNA (uracil(1498)-N(3))-methyltransferase [Cellulosimicrobium sp. CUA-896]|uniref:16S rRNA (uracil(1498)-N(3))-methyltransferase n=1 Tax=Cellulosimicrobium sp. CUA-896 TaxID=1517881 RepID=UPI000969A230|nr:16S rRNA (uracil(1498)-N(3))-methyltransferase [Cellulosimicrobium sp. CUA-896]OLT53996.1 16S rRNA (uracil(1498)-N(3))-methyltransferase [Cellulosimicrobium sp. CUA-896]